MLFMIRQITKVGTILRNIHFFWSPEKRQLFFNQFFKNRVFLLVVTSDVNRLSKKHWLFELVVINLRKNAVFHRHLPLNLTGATSATIIHIALAVISAIACVLVVQCFQTKFIGGQ